MRFFGKNRVYESVNVLGTEIRVNSIPIWILIACRAGRPFFPPTFLHMVSFYLAFKLMESVRNMSLSFTFSHTATKVKKMFDLASCSSIFKLRLLSQKCCSLLGLKFHDLGSQLQRKPEYTLYLSTFTSFFGILQSCRLRCCAFKLFFVIRGLFDAK